MSALRLLHVITLLALLIGEPAKARAQADADFEWQVSTFAEQGAPSALLAYAVPETDNALFHFLCIMGQSGPILADLYIDAGTMPPGDRTDVSFSVDDAFETRAAAIIEGAFGPQVRVELGAADPLWDVLKAGSAGRVAARGGSWIRFHLAGSHAAISDFLDRCAGGNGGPP